MPSASDLQSRSAPFHGQSAHTASHEQDVFRQASRHGTPPLMLIKKLSRKNEHLGDKRFMQSSRCRTPSAVLKSHRALCLRCKPPRTEKRIRQASRQSTPPLVLKSCRSVTPNQNLVAKSSGNRRGVACHLLVLKSHRKIDRLACECPSSTF